MSTESSAAMDEPPPAQMGGRIRGGMRGVGRWIWSHKIGSILILVVLYLVFEYFTLPSASGIARLRKENPGITALMEQRRAEAREQGKKFSIRQQWIPLSRISRDMIHAVIVAEDGTFYGHEGIDWYEMRESIKKDIERGRFARGGSTITQQTAKNLYFSTSKNPLRKLKELLVSMRLEDVLTKDRILEVYLNIIEWGNGIFGVDAAAMAYFGKRASDLSRDESARLAAVIASPLRHAPNTDSRYVRTRKNIILTRMEARGW